MQYIANLYLRIGVMRYLATPKQVDGTLATFAHPVKKRQNTSIP